MRPRVEQVETRAGVTSYILLELSLDRFVRALIMAPAVEVAQPVPIPLGWNRLVIPIQAGAGADHNPMVNNRAPGEFRNLAQSSYISGPLGYGGGFTVRAQRLLKSPPFNYT